MFFFFLKEFSYILRRSRIKFKDTATSVISRQFGVIMIYDLIKLFVQI